MSHDSFPVSPTGQEKTDIHPPVCQIYWQKLQIRPFNVHVCACVWSHWKTDDWLRLPQRCHVHFPLPPHSHWYVSLVPQ